jgi:hypothetical protein
MKALSYFSLGLAFLSAPALAAVSYVPAGTAIPLSQAVNDMVVKGQGTQVVFDHGVVYLELGNETDKDQRFGKAEDVEILAREIDAQRVATVIKAGNLTWNKSWNKLATEDYTAFDTVQNYRDLARDSKEMDIAETEEDLYRTVISLFAATKEAMSITGDVVSYFDVTSGYSGGAHDWASLSFVTKEWPLGDAASLLKYVDNQDLLRALKADKYLRKAAKLAGKEREFLRTTQLTDLDRLLADATFGGGADLPVAWALTPMEQFQKFAIWDYDVKSGEVLVRLGLEYNSEVNRGQFEQVGLRVKATPEFAKTLAAMKKNGEGLFMKDVAKDKRP